MEKATLTLYKHADKTTNKMIIPKNVIKQWGNEFYMDIYCDKIILRPTKNRKGK